MRTFASAGPTWGSFPGVGVATGDPVVGAGEVGVGEFGCGGRSGVSGVKAC